MAYVSTVISTESSARGDHCRGELDTTQPTYDHLRDRTLTSPKTSGYCDELTCVWNCFPRLLRGSWLLPTVWGSAHRLEYVNELLGLHRVRLPGCAWLVTTSWVYKVGTFEACVVLSQTRPIQIALYPRSFEILDSRGTIRRFFSRRVRQVHGIHYKKSH